MDNVSRCRTRRLAPVHSRTMESDCEFGTNRTLMKSGDRGADIEDQKLDSGDQTSSGYRGSQIQIGLRRELTREKMLFTCWPDHDGENERSLLEDLVM
ncbi:hypothetical protein TNCV_2799501 [Trichonephila clavipes]|nr:hypothetical protein TNCV_2799501 [Trichonephila clavipes]